MESILGIFTQYALEKYTDDKINRLCKKIINQISILFAHFIKIMNSRIISLFSKHPVNIFRFKSLITVLIYIKASNIKKNLFSFMENTIKLKNIFLFLYYKFENRGKKIISLNISSFLGIDDRDIHNFY